MQAYLDKMKEKRKSDYSSIGGIIGGFSGMGIGIVGVCGGIVVANTLLSPVVALMGLGATGCEVIKGIGIGAIAGIIPGFLVGKQIGMVSEKLSAPSDDTLKREFLEEISEKVMQGCSSEKGMQKCKSFVHHLEVIEGKCEEADIDVKDMKHLIKKLKQ
ncbi:MAG: hypothetical protein K2W94_08150 [Alphaproteobacteria bacterium]|nr:hypothetical protein [Alphaproteobacteria bacterium]